MNVRSAGFNPVGQGCGYAAMDLRGMDEWYAFILSIRFPDGVYRDQGFICKDCGEPCVWPASRQKWWFEQAGGHPDSTAVRCRRCRIAEKQRKTEARRAHQEGLARKQLQQKTMEIKR